MRKVLPNTKDPNQSKLGPNWEGPYRVTTIRGIGTYHFETLEGNALLRPWNIANLKKFYF